MNNYYCLVAGLPNITIDDTKLAFSVEEFRIELEEQLTTKDYALIQLFFLQYDNNNLYKLLQNKETTLEQKGNYTREDLLEAIQIVEETDNPTDSKFPSYFYQFIANYQNDQSLQEGVAWEDQLSALYYDYARNCKNKFIAQWFEMNLNINNMLTTIACKKYNLDITKAVIGNSEIAQIIRKSGQRDMGLTGIIDYLEEILRISEEKDLMQREKKLDLLRWNWLEENVFFHFFSIEKIFTYLIQIDIIERWTLLDPQKGEEQFRQLIHSLKESVDIEKIATE